MLEKSKHFDYKKSKKKFLDYFDNRYNHTELNKINILKIGAKFNYLISF